MSAGAGSQSRHAAVASFVGTTLEWYDFFIYGTTAALVFGDLFFPAFSSLAGTLASFATLAVGFAARPLGSVLFGHFGDRIGRKRTLIVTLLLMGISTVLIGVLPTFDQVGVLAPILLVALRLLQGIGLGGEWGGAALISVEHAPHAKRGLLGSATQMGAPGGMLLASGAVALSNAVSGSGYESWGWRLPFLASLVVVIAGIGIRLGLAESPAFEHAKANRGDRLPIGRVLRERPTSVLLGAGMAGANNVIFYVVSTYTLSYATTNLGLPESELLSHLTITAAVYLVTIPLFGALADRVGLRRQVLVAATGCAVIAFPYFLLVDTASSPVILFAMIGALAVVQSAAYAPQPAIYCGLFPAEYRYTGASLSYALPTTIVGGTAPFVATALQAWAGSTWPVATYIVVLSLVAALCAAKARYAGEQAGADERVAARA